MCKRTQIKMYIAWYCEEFKKRINLPIIRITDENAETVIDHYARINSMPYPLILEDVSYISPNAQSKLLSFLEETSLNVVLLASSDNISPMLIGRITEIYKRVPKVQTRFTSMDKCRDELNLGGFCPLDVLKKQMHNSPLLYRNDILTRKFSNKERLLKIIENEYKSKN